MKLLQKRENYEAKNIGNFKLAYPSENEEKQQKYEEYLQASTCTVPFSFGKGGSAATKPSLKKQNSAATDAKYSPLKAKGKTKLASKDTQDKSNLKGKELLKKVTKSPYEVGFRRMITPSSQKQRKRIVPSNNTQ